MITFAQPLWLILLPLPLAAALRQARRGATIPDRQPALRHPQAALLARLSAGHRGPAWWPWALGCALLVVALARPQWLDFSSPEAHQGHDLMVAIDVSGSMRALDYATQGEARSRLAVVKRSLDGFLARRSRDRIGVVLFGDHPAVFLPLTRDLDLVRAQLADLRPGILGERTALGDAIALAVSRLARRPPASRLLLLFSDGADTAGVTPPLDALAEARRQGVRIFTVGVGSGKEVLFPRGPVLPPQVTRLPPDTALLRRLAQESGGHFYAAASAKDMARILADIDAQAPTLIRDPAHARHYEGYWLPLAAGLILLLQAQWRRSEALP